ncbi:MAG: hypothetical protein IJX96_01885 [Clostridia bacterium]|nr:hypothetical protein [Clostridia bacterium]
MKQKILREFALINESTDAQFGSLQKQVASLAKKQIDQVNKSEKEFMESKNRSIDGIESLKTSFSQKPDVDKDDLFLFSTAPQRETFNAQIALLEGASKGLEALHNLQNVANSVKAQAEQEEKSLEEFIIFVRIRDVKNEKSLTRLASELLETQVEDFAKGANITVEEARANGQEIFLSPLKRIIKIEVFGTYASLYKGATYERLKKMSVVLDKHGIKNRIASKSVMECVEKDKTVESCLTKTDNVMPKTKKEIEKKFKLQRTLKSLGIFLAVLIAFFCVSGMDAIEEFISKSAFLKEYEEMILTLIYPAMLVLIIASIVSRSTVNKKEQRVQEKYQQYCIQLIEEYLENHYYKLLFDLTNDYYQSYKDHYFEKRKNLVKQMYDFQKYILEEMDNCVQLFVKCFAPCLPNGLLDNERLLNTIIRVMREGRASEYKEARARAEEIMEREDNARRQEEYYRDRAEKDEAQREAVLDSQRNMERYAAEQARAAQRAAEAQARVAEAQERAAEYAKDAAKNSEKMLDIERDREIREKDEYWRRKTNT